MSTRAQLRRLPDRGSYDPATVAAILDAGFLAHVGFCVDGQPFVIPTLYGHDGASVYLHGSAASRMMRELDKGVPVCVTVTLVDGLVLARSAFHHSMNYRSVVVFGTARKIEDTGQKTRALRIISEHLIPGRWAEVRSPSQKELKATTVLSLRIEEASTKIRTGPPSDDDDDYDLPVWAGLLPLNVRPAAPVPDIGVSEPAPDYVAQWPATRIPHSMTQEDGHD
jgi:uncharacterized protein